MCTQTRTPSPSRCAEIASSKSFAVSGSIVNVSRSRRSVRPSSDGSGRSKGSNSRRTPSCSSRASSTVSTRSAGPSARWRRAAAARDHDRGFPSPTSARPFCLGGADARREVRLAHYQPPAAGDLDHDQVAHPPNPPRRVLRSDNAAVPAHWWSRRSARVPRRPGVRAVGVLAARARGLRRIHRHDLSRRSVARRAEARDCGREPPGLAREHVAARMRALEWLASDPQEAA